LYKTVPQIYTTASLGVLFFSDCTHCDPQLVLLVFFCPPRSNRGYSAQKTDTTFNGQKMKKCFEEFQTDKSASERPTLLEFDGNKAIRDVDVRFRNPREKKVPKNSLLADRNVHFGATPHSVKTAKTAKKGG
jgi:hypothetical protein